MRLVGNIPHPEITITIFHMNDKYVVKMEAGPMEQTFKFYQEEIKNIEDLKKIIDFNFVEKCKTRFNEMYLQLTDAKKKSE